MRPRPRWGQGWRKGVIITMKRGFLQSKKIHDLKVFFIISRKNQGIVHYRPSLTIGQTLHPIISPKQKRKRSRMVRGSLSSGIGTNPNVL